MPLTGVAGWPVAHSRSPQLHDAAFAALGLVGWESQLLPIPPEVFEATVRALPDSGFAGINVTIPHKEAALSLADTASETARSIGAANTLTFQSDGTIKADNTDVPAIAGAVSQMNPAGSRSRATVLGAGGSARAAARALLDLGFEEVGVWNRNVARADRLVVSLAAGERLRSVERPVGSVLVNATPVGLLEGTGPADLGLTEGLPPEAELLVDLVYSKGGTQLARMASDAGLAVADGLEILVRQGALSIEIWTGELPDLAPLREAVADPV